MTNEIKYTKLIEQYSIDENDGSGPFPMEANSIMIIYDEKTGKPIKARITATTPVDEAIRYAGPRMKVEEDPSKLAKIVKFFHSK